MAIPIGKASQVIRAGRKANHLAIDDAAAEVLAGEGGGSVPGTSTTSSSARLTGSFDHGKGATPAFDNWAEDATDLTPIPLSMAEPVLIARAGGTRRMASASATWRRAQLLALAAQADAGLGGPMRRSSRCRNRAASNARFFLGKTDVSELPSAYKNAAAVFAAEIETFDLAEAVRTRRCPSGCIMAGASGSRCTVGDTKRR